MFEVMVNGGDEFNRLRDCVNLWTKVQIYSITIGVLKI